MIKKHSNVFISVSKYNTLYSRKMSMRTLKMTFHTKISCQYATVTIKKKSLVYIVCFSKES